MQTKRKTPTNETELKVMDDMNGSRMAREPWPMQPPPSTWVSPNPHEAHYNQQMFNTYSSSTPTHFPRQHHIQQTQQPPRRNQVHRAHVAPQQTETDIPVSPMSTHSGDQNRDGNKPPPNRCVSPVSPVGSYGRSP